MIVIALMIFASTRGPRYRVQVCMAYQTRTACKTVSAKSEEGALRSGISNACADIAAGITETMGCEHGDPQSVKWLQRPNN